MKNLAAYTKIYLQGTGIVTDEALEKILEHIKALVIKATVAQLSDFVELVNSPDLQRDEKFRELKKALVMR
jgi:hypothetical protein